MDFEYDSYNRIQRMTYPDGEVVSYEYNKGGLLKWVSGLKNDIPYSYINDIRYNKFELKESVEYGNGTVMTYDYDQLQRLKHLESNTAQQETMQEIEYEYDGVGNITKITNSAGALANGLGGTYNNEYTYDNLYRLSTADGDWQGMEFLDYNLKMSYYKNGRVEHKKLMANTMTAAGHTDINYQRRYFYDNSSQPNTLTRIEEQEWMSPNGNSGGSGGGHVIGIAPVTPYTPPVTYEHEFEWDASGNMTYHHHEGENSSYERYLCWDEVNRLQGVVDDTHQSFYQYDANGERTYKLTTSEQAQMVNGHWYYYTVMDNPTLYVSPYLVVTRQGYTKHYYAENERIASKIGMGGLTDICQCLCPDMTLQSGNQGGDPMNQLPYEPADLTDCEGPEECFYDKLSLNNNHFERVMRECLESNPNVEPNTLNEALYSFRENMEEYEPDCYWYHPDHLGSSSWITYTDGEAVQHLHYLPWGENFVDQQNTSFSSMYTFSAKEKDAETGYSYFGSRYYSSDLSIWLSVDPMSDKYPSLSPYVYCANNPIKLVDPNGEKVFITGEGEEWATEQLSNSYQKLNITRDEFGMLSTEVDDITSLSKDEKKIYEAINSNDVIVNIIVETGNRFNTEFGDFEMDQSSGFAGNVLSNDKSMAFTRQLISKSKVIENYYSNERGKLIAHELTESYYGGKFSIEKQCIAPPAKWAYGQNPYNFNPHYRFAHDNATFQPYSKRDCRNMFCEGFSCSPIKYDFFYEKMLRP
jgi:RHS repeat-associated protein